MMTWILIASVIAFATKLAGYLIPSRFLTGPQVQRVADLLTAGLLASLVTLNTVATGTSLHADSRLLALVVAAIALWFRAPFLVVVILGTAAAALGRLAGLP